MVSAEAEIAHLTRVGDVGSLNRGLRRRAAPARDEMVERGRKRPLRLDASRDDKISHVAPMKTPGANRSGSVVRNMVPAARQHKAEDCGLA